MMQLGESSRKNTPRDALALVMLGACSGQAGTEVVTVEPATPQAPNCSDFERAEPVDLDVSASVIATEPNRIWHLTELSPPLIADGAGIYWHDTYGSLSAQRRGDLAVVRLLEGTEPVEGDTRNRYMLGMATNADGVFVSDGYLPANLIDWYAIGEFNPPSRLLSVPKQGGPRPCCSSRKTRHFGRSPPTTSGWSFWPSDSKRPITR